MNCKIVILSDKVLAGDARVDIQALSKIMLGYGLNTEEIEIKKQNEKFDDFSSPTFLFLHDDLIDGFVSECKIFYSSKSEIVEGEGVLTGDDYPILVLPIEADLPVLMKKSLEKIKERFSLPNILTFRMYGQTKDQVEEKLSGISISSEYSLYSDGLSTDLYLKKDISSEFISDDEVIINKTFGENIYAQSNMSIAEVATKMLNLSNIKIAINDSFTCGSVARELLQCGASRLSSETFSFSIDNGLVKTDTESTFRDENEMVNKTSFILLEKKKADISIVVAGRKVGTYYHINMALGSKKSIEVYNLSIEGNQQDAITVATNSALFNLIKKLRIKDFENL